jgi:hypothetical protein
VIAVLLFPFMGDQKAARVIARSVACFYERIQETQSFNVSRYAALKGWRRFDS